MHRAVCLLLLSCAVALVAAVAPAGACACGVALDATITGQRALVVHDDGAEQVLVSFDLQAEAGKQAAVVFPVPSRPRVAAYAGKEDPFEYLARVTDPPPPPSSSGDDGATSSAAGGGVDVYGREEVGGYDVARLGADDPNALARWLADNGYSVPDGADPILSDYVEDGWSYVAVKLAEEGQQGALKPLVISFKSERPVYPMRLEQLAQAPIDLTLWVAGDQRVAVDLTATTFGDEVGRLEDPPPPALKALLGDSRYLTRVEARGLSADAIDDDFVAEPAADRPDPYEERFPGDTDSGRTPNDEFRTVVTIAAVAGAIAILVLLGLIGRGWLLSRRGR